MTTYHIPFHSNVWFIIVLGIVGYTALFLFPKRFPTSLTILFVIAGITFVVSFDHTIGIPPFDFYDVNGKSADQFIDILSYIMYGPFGYFFLYFYDKFQIKGLKQIIYVIIWTVLATIAEFAANYFGVYHYKNGYILFYSVPVYLFVQSLNIVLYRFITQAKE